MNKTTIDYVDFSWNPVTGCLGPKGDGVRCHYCYANRLANGRLRKLYLAHRVPFAGDMRNPFAPRFWLPRLDQPFDLKRPSRIFVCDMADLFGDWVSRATQNLIFRAVREADWHTFLFLTKWPSNLAQFNPWPPNAWVGATATDASSALYALCQMENVQAPVRFLSLEPLLGPIDPQRKWPVEWIIVGAQTGPGATPPNLEWVHDIAKAATRHCIPIFLKNNLHCWPPRQEFPE